MKKQNEYLGIEKEYWLTDVETGFRYKVSKERYEQYISMWDNVVPRIQSDKILPILTGTAGSLDMGGYEFTL